MQGSFPRTRSRQPDGFCSFRIRDGFCAELMGSNLCCCRERLSGPAGALSVVFRAQVSLVVLFCFDRAKASGDGFIATAKQVADKQKFIFMETFPRLRNQSCVSRFTLSLAQRRDVSAALDSREMPRERTASGSGAPPCPVSRFPIQRCARAQPFHEAVVSERRIARGPCRWRYLRWRRPPARNNCRR